MQDQPTLWIIGDSFSQPRKSFDRATIWPEIVAALLSVDTGDRWQLVNQSWHGVSQDYCWAFLQSWMHNNKVKPQDRVIVVLTHPNRYWYIDDKPDLSNGHYTIDLDDHITAAQSQAIQAYMKEIQRPRLDTIQQLNRLGWLSHAVTHWNLHRPLVIKAFDFDLYEAENYRLLNLAQGNLYDLQNREFNEAQRTDNTTTEFFAGTDPRYCHLTLTNHKILAARIADCLLNDSLLDLDSAGLVENIFYSDTINDEEFCRQELDPEMLALMREKQRTGGVVKRNLTSWLRSAKIK